VPDSFADLHTEHNGLLAAYRFCQINASC
jgi:hypothetical protein